MYLPRLSGLVLVAALGAGCGTTPDERPATLEVIALSILAPSCGQVQCHSTSTHTEGLAFDTIAAAKDSLGSLRNADKIFDIIRDGEMPPDAPMADADVALLEAWIAAGAPGL